MSIQMSLTVPALERLIKDDEEMEFKLKEGVIANFVEKHLKRLLNDSWLRSKIEEVKQAVELEAKAVISREFGSMKKDYYGRVDSFTPNSSFKASVESMVIIKINGEIHKMITSGIEAALKAYDVEKMVKKNVDASIKEWTKSEIDKRAKEMLANAVKSI